MNSRILIRKPILARGRAYQTAETTASKSFGFPETWNGDRPTAVNSKDYRLTIDGDVSMPLDLTLEELCAMPNVLRTLRISCLEGWAADVPWEGITLSYLLSQSGASFKNLASARVESITGYSRIISSPEIANPDNMIALKAGGLPLTVGHGYPSRLVVPTRPGPDWVKYVRRITCTNRKSKGNQ